MQGSKTKAKIKANKVHGKKKAKSLRDSDDYYHLQPSWRFSACDSKMWSITDVHVQSIFWTEIHPRLVSLESMKWSDILIQDKKQNRAIKISDLNKIAVDRLDELMIELDAIISLTLRGKHRIYGYIASGTFNLLWIDLEHGDSHTCVCRSYLKHT